ncbi:MAG: hypothetical protein H0U74_07520 [Bradymonadaceae bacterium]|nr:hypothetical protein [Lujinxingiaceae bacterium]
MAKLIDIARSLLPTWTYRICFALVALTGGALCFVPLFNILGYESAAFFGVTLGLLATGLTLHAQRIGAFALPLDVEREGSPARDFARRYAHNLALLVLPFAILLLNALRVANCDLASGVGFWLLIPTFSILVGQTGAWVALVCSPRRRWLARTIAFGIPLVSALWFGLLLALEPPIVGHQWLIGYFGGSIYDEAMAVPTSLIWYRALNILLVGSVLISLETLWVRKLGRPTRAPALWALVLTLVFALGWGFRQRAGIDIDRGFIMGELGGMVETEHFIIYYPARDPFIDQIGLIAEDHEYRYAQLSTFFESDPISFAGNTKIKSFIYPDREAKGQLMGARNTLIAKLWLHEMHIMWRGYGDSMLTHELAHIFTEPFGSGPLRLSMQRGVGVNMGLVEGIATAADWPVGELTPHETGAALRRAELAPNIRGLVGATGFWTQASGRAYVLMGSFVRFLIDTYGIAVFKQAYAKGDFQRAYGKSTDTLVSEWEAYLDQMTISDDQIEMARYLFDRPSIFAKVCARTIAELRRQANEAVARGDVFGARAIFERIISFDAGNAAYRVEYARVLQSARDYEAALAVLEALRSGELGRVQEAELLAMVGDLQWHLGEFDAAATAYSSCLEVGVPADLERSLRVKRATVTVDDAVTRTLAYEHLIGRGGGEITMFFAMEWLSREPENPIAAYLVGRRLWISQKWEHALPYLEAVVGRMGSEVLDAEARRVLAQCYFFAGRLEQAQSLVEELAMLPMSRYSVEAVEWLDRIAWKRRNSVSAR